MLGTYIAGSTAIAASITSVTAVRASAPPTTYYLLLAMVPPLTSLIATLCLPPPFDSLSILVPTHSLLRHFVLEKEQKIR